MASLDRLIARRRECIEGIARAGEEIRRLELEISRAVCRELLAPESDLTAREREVIALVAAGEGNKEIASELGITVRTAKFHVSRLLAKFHVADRHELAAIAKGAG